MEDPELQYRMDTNNKQAVITVVGMTTVVTGICIWEEIYLFHKEI